MRIAVITPYFKEPLSWLRRAVDSVRQQTHADLIHILVADGHPQDALDDWGVQHARLPQSHGDNGNTPRAHGAALAMAQGVDAIAFLDADNWFHPDHLAELAAVQQRTGADLVASRRVIVAVDGSRLMESKAGPGIDQGGHADTSCLLLARSGFSVLSLWTTMPRPFTAVCDLVFVKGARRQGLRLVQASKATLYFTSRYAIHFQQAGKAPPAYATAMNGVRRAQERLARLSPEAEDALLRGHAMPQSPPLSLPRRLSLVLPRSLPAPFAPVLQALEGAAQAGQLRLQAQVLADGAESLLATEALLQTGGADQRDAFVLVLGGGSPQRRGRLARAWAESPQPGHERPRVILLHHPPEITPQTVFSAYNDALTAQAWRLVAPGAAHREMFHVACHSGMGAVVDATSPDAVKALLADLLAAEG